MVLVGRGTLVPMATKKPVKESWIATGSQNCSGRRWLCWEKAECSPSLQDVDLGPPCGASRAFPRPAPVSQSVQHRPLPLNLSPCTCLI